MNEQVHGLVQGGLSRRQPQRYTSGGEAMYFHWVEERHSFVIVREKVSVDAAGPQEILGQVLA